MSIWLGQKNDQKRVRSSSGGGGDGGSGSGMHSFIHSFIYLCSIDHTDVEFVSKYKYKYKQFVLNIGIGRHQLYTNTLKDPEVARN